MGIGPDLLLLLIWFWLLFFISSYQGVLHWKNRSLDQKILDSIGLLSQGLLVPLASLAVASLALPKLLFSLKETLVLPWWLAFVLPFTLVDYVYYWNHRLLHSGRFWFLHKVHHSAEQMDFLITSRNSFITPIFLIYLWAQAIFSFILKEPMPYLLGAALSAGLDLWRHSGLKTPGLIKRAFSFLILPEDHSFHHGAESAQFNFGANLKIWDLLHGTYSKPNIDFRLGIPLRLALWQKVFTPWRQSS